MKKIRILIIDDSALVRQVLTEILNSAPDFEVVGTAADPYLARTDIKRLNPDVLTLDVEMPRMDGVTFLRNVMRLRPMPVVMVSSLTTHGAEVTLNALELGAVDFVTKPMAGIEKGLKDYSEEIISKVRAASRAKVRPPLDLGRTGRVPLPMMRPAAASLGYRTTDRLIAIGASTGGTEALREVLEAMPADAPAVVMAQHLPGTFSEPFARRLDSCSAMKVVLAEQGQQLLQGHAYLAPGDQHLRIERSGARFVCRLEQTPPVNRHRPSVDVLFDSVAKAAGANAVGVLLTGMGADGARGLLAMRTAGASTIAQDENTSVVWGMPGQAVKLGAVEIVLPLSLIAAQSLIFAAR